MFWVSLNYGSLFLEAHMEDLRSRITPITVQLQKTLKTSLGILKGRTDFFLPT